MEWGAAQPSSAIARPVSVEIGQAARSEARQAPPDACIVAVGPLEAPWLSDLFPSTLIRKSRFEGQPVGVEHVRFRARSLLSRLPGLEDRYGPTLLRDAADALMGAGSGTVDILMARVIGARPWELDKDGVAEVLGPYLADFPGTILVYPDLSGPTPITRTSVVDQEALSGRLSRFVAQQAEGWKERYQIALADVPPLDRERMGRFLMQDALGTDLALCRWRGTAHALGLQGWRSTAASVTGLLASGDPRIALGIQGRRLALLDPRRAPKSRARFLSYTEDRVPDPPYAQQFLTVELDSDLDSGRIVSEPTFRRPMGTWPLSALRMAKAIHQRLMDTASRFVFEPADQRQVMALTSAIQYSMRPFVEAGLLSGPDGADQVAVNGHIDRTEYNVHHLVVDLSALLRPWGQQVMVRVALRPDTTPQLEVS